MCEDALSLFIPSSVWFYCITGEAATATLVFTTVEGSPQGNLVMIGFAYAFGEITILSEF